jgi:imidazolonepropionase-like amidohydrolase
MSLQKITVAMCFIATLVPVRAVAQQYVRPMSPVVALTHVRIIDGTGAPARDDQMLIIEGGRIVQVGAAASVQVPVGATVLDLRGRTVIPGLVGMHDHLFYQLEPTAGTVAVAAQRNFARLYLASGVTSIRTAGTINFNEDAALRRDIEAGKEPGPRIHLTGPYLNAETAEPDPERIAQHVDDYANRGATSFKAYATLRSSELQAAIAVAHRRGLTITGHLCAVGFREAAALGIDNLEHGVAVDTEFFTQKRPDECPNQWDALGALIQTDTGHAVAARQPRGQVPNPRTLRLRASKRPCLACGAFVSLSGRLQPMRRDAMIRARFESLDRLNLTKPDGPISEPTAIGTGR